MAVSEKMMQELRSQELINKMALQEAEATRKMEIQAKINRQTEAEKMAAKQAEKDMQVIIDAIAEADRVRKDADFKQSMAHEAEEMAQKTAHERELADIEKAKNEAYAQTIATIMGSISEDLIAAITVGGKTQLAEVVAEHLSPYAIANNEGVVETTNRLMRGLGFDEALTHLGQLHNGDDPGQRGILHQCDDLVGHGGDDALDHLQQRHLEKDLALCHAQHLTGLPLAYRHALNAALIDDGKITCVIDDKGDDAGRHTTVRKVTPDIVIEPFAGAVEDDDQLKHQRCTADDPHDDVEKPADRLTPAAQGKGDDKSQRKREQQRQEKDL